MNIEKIPLILEQIKRQYTSFENPDFSFVEKAIAAQPYKFVLTQLAKSYDLEEVTEPNDDVCFRYLVSKSDRQWLIELSMLGFYATVLRISELKGTEIVAPETSQKEEKLLLCLLKSQGFEVLTRMELEEPLVINLQNTEPENTCIYQALFSDTDVLPWRPIKGVGVN